MADQALDFGQKQTSDAAQCKVRCRLKYSSVSRLPGLTRSGTQSFEGPFSIGFRRCGADLLVAMALLQQAVVFRNGS